MRDPAVPGPSRPAYAARFRRLRRPRAASQTHSCPGSKYLSASHPQVAQREEHRQPRGVLGQTAVAHLGVAELLLDDPEGVLDLGPYAGLGLLKLLGNASYSLYLLHKPFYHLAHENLGLRQGWQIFSLTVAVAILAHWLVELPLRKALQKLWNHLQGSRSPAT